MEKTTQAQAKQKPQRLALRTDNIMALTGASNAHQLAIRAGVSAPSMAHWTDPKGTLNILYLDTFLKVLKATGMTSEDILEMRLGDLFKIVDADASTNGHNGHTKKRRTKKAA